VAVTVHSLWWKVAVATRISTLPFGWGRMRAAWSAVSTVAAGRVGRTLRCQYWNLKECGKIGSA